MGMYSKNRFRNLSALEEEKVVVDVKEEAEEEVEAPIEIDDDVLSMLSDDDEPDVDIEEAVATLESVPYDESFNGLIESNINILNVNEKTMHDLIGLDFKTIQSTKACDESSIQSLNDQKKQKISESFDKIMNGAKASIGNAAAYLSAKAENMATADKGIYEKYCDKITEESMVGFEGIKNFAFPNNESVTAAKIATSSDEIINNTKEAVEAIKNATDRKQVNEAVIALRDKFNEASSSIFENASKAIATTECWLPKACNLTFLKNYANSSCTKKAIAVSMKHAQDSLISLSADAGAAIEECTADDFGLYKANAIYSVCTSAAMASTKQFQMYSDIVVREVANIRKAIIVCGRYASGKKLNDAMVSELCENSDTYVFEFFEN